MITLKVRFADAFDVKKMDDQTKRFTDEAAASDWIYKNREIIRKVNDEPLGGFTYKKSELLLLLTNPEEFAEIRWQKYQAVSEQNYKEK